MLLFVLSEEKLARHTIFSKLGSFRTIDTNHKPKHLFARQNIEMPAAKLRFALDDIHIASHSISFFARPVCVLLERDYVNTT